ncbi:MAG: hypothetical protein LBJ10_01665 [Clostridiales bacterium]|jgi:hypothetical protein|nr:hypothetical protein [Clostridiales bacterium]
MVVDEKCYDRDVIFEAGANKKYELTNETAMKRQSAKNGRREARAQPQGPEIPKWVLEWQKEKRRAGARERGRNGA